MSYRLPIIPVLFVLACGDHDHDSHEHEEEGLGDPTGSPCPPDSTLTYETFGQQFMDDFCVRCHSSTLSGDLRLDAPEDANFDTLAGVRQHLDHLDVMAAAGPLATNEIMPDGDPRPSLELRLQLGEWIACGAP